MPNVASDQHADPWRRRLYLPNYRVGQAAKYAQIAPETAGRWHKLKDSGRVLSMRPERAAYSYMQLIELAVVAAFRKAKIPLKEISRTRDYARNNLESEYPFAEHRFKKLGKELVLDYAEIAGNAGENMLLHPGRDGQLAWASVIGKLEEFEYEDGIALRWHVAGPSSNIVIDPKIAFGAPAVDGVPTWVIRGRWQAGESLNDISDDFDLDRGIVEEALGFEGISPDNSRRDLWTH